MNVLFDITHVQIDKQNLNKSFEMVKTKTNKSLVI